MLGYIIFYENLKAYSGITEEFALVYVLNHTKLTMIEIVILLYSGVNSKIFTIKG